jgi:hypothetical protein
VERISRLAEKGHDDIEMGFHLCNGNFEHRHRMEPRATVTMVGIATVILQGAQYPVR